MCDVDAGCGGSCLRQRGWRRFFCLVWPRCREWGDLLASVERYDAGALVIWSVVACGSDANNANDANRRVVGAAGVGGVCVASAVVEGAGIVAVIVGAANYVEVAAVVAAEAGDDGVDDVGGVVEVAVAVVGG